MDTQVMEWSLMVGLGFLFVGILVALGYLAGYLLYAGARSPF